MCTTKGLAGDEQMWFWETFVAPVGMRSWMPYKFCLNLCLQSSLLSPERCSGLPLMSTLKCLYPNSIPGMGHYNNTAMGPIGHHCRWTQFVYCIAGRHVGMWETLLGTKTLTKSHTLSQNMVCYRPDRGLVYLEYKSPGTHSGGL